MYSRYALLVVLCLTGMTEGGVTGLVAQNMDSTVVKLTCNAGDVNAKEKPLLMTIYRSTVDEKLAEVDYMKCPEICKWAEGNNMTIYSPPCVASDKQNATFLEIIIFNHNSSVDTKYWCQFTKINNSGRPATQNWTITVNKTDSENKEETTRSPNDVTTTAPVNGKRCEELKQPEGFITTQKPASLNSFSHPTPADHRPDFSSVIILVSLTLFVSLITLLLLIVMFIFYRRQKKSSYKNNIMDVGIGEMDLMVCPAMRNEKKSHSLPMFLSNDKNYNMDVNIGEIAFPLKNHQDQMIHPAMINKDMNQSLPIFLSKDLHE